MPMNPLNRSMDPTALPKFRLDKLSVANPIVPPMASPTIPPQPQAYAPQWDAKKRRGPNVWDNVDQISPSVDKAAQQTGWPKEYINAQAIIESGARNVGPNKYGAKGVFGFRDYPNVEKQFANDNMNPDSAALHNAKMMQWLVKKTGGDTTAALARYNAGPYTGLNDSPYAQAANDLVKQQRAAQLLSEWESKYGRQLATKISPKPVKGS